MLAVDETNNNTLVFYVNGREICEAKPDPEMTLLYYLRTVLGLSGTKLACGEGGCGACTVMLSKYDKQTSKVSHYSAYSCLTPLCHVHGLAVTTVEGIGSTKTKLHPVQERIALSHGTQCGFCTPGMVMSMYSLLRNNPNPSIEQVEEAIDGNLCRCTGYRPIMDGFKSFCCGLKEDCCQNMHKKEGTIVVKNGMLPTNGLTKLDPTQELIFPPKLMINNPSFTRFSNGKVAWLIPISLKEALEMKRDFSAAKIVSGNTRIGIETRFKSTSYSMFITTSEITELNIIEEVEDGLIIGASATLSSIINKLNQLIKSLPKHKSRCFQALLSMLCTVGGNQIRNLSSLGGNLCSAAPTSDIVPVLLAARSQITIASANSGKRTLYLTQEFFTSYRKVGLATDELILSILIPFTSENEYCIAFAQNRRKDDDRAIVNVCYWLSLSITNQNDNEYVIKDTRIAYGGVSPTTKLSTVTRAALIGKIWNYDIISIAYDKLLEEYHIEVSAPGGMAQYREILICSFFLKFFFIISNELKITGDIINTESILDTLKRGPSISTQVYNELSADQSEYDTVGMPLPHKSALQHTTGEARFCDDNPPKNNELFAHVILSKRPHAKIISIDAAEALATPGVVDCITYNDVPKNGSNNMSHSEDDFLFATNEVQHVGQLIGLVVAEDRITARKAVDKVKIVYEDLPAIFTIEEAIEQASYHSYDHSLCKGDTPLGFSLSDHISTGEMHVGGQEHFYLETQSCIVTPGGEDSEVEIICGTQSVSDTQQIVSIALGIPNNRVLVRCKRIGGAFGGKVEAISQLSACVAIASFKLKRSIRCQLEREDDMSWSGKRCPILVKYKVGFSKQGKLLALEMNIYANSGYIRGDTHFNLDAAILNCCNVYHIPHLKVYGYICKTNITRMVAMRAVSLPQVFLVTESIIDNIAVELKSAPHLIRKMNFYGEELVTCCGVPVESDIIEKCWDRLILEVDLDNLSKSISKFNSIHRYRKRGVSLIHSLFPLGFAGLSNSCALVHIISDGFVLLSHGGIEMGQGLYIKMIQVCAKALNIDPSKVHISETSTNTIVNTNPSGGSFTSDNNGMAIIDACRQLNERLMPIKKAKPDATWEEWIKEALHSKINLSAHGYYNYEGMSWNWKLGSGRPHLYYTYGAACSVVELDALTGEYLVLKSDIIMDVGKSLNPAIDIGQIEGAFMQGVGLFTIEELTYLNTDYGDKLRGSTLCRGPTKYKIPSIKSVPLEFNVRLLHNSNNVKSVHGSKGIGEPPLYLGCSIYFALLNAIQSVRCDNETPPLLKYDSPLTVEKIRLACTDSIVKKVKQIHPVNNIHQKLNWTFTI